MLGSTVLFLFYVEAKEAVKNWNVTKFIQNLVQGKINFKI